MNYNNFVVIFITIQKNYSLQLFLKYNFFEMYVTAVNLDHSKIPIFNNACEYFEW